MSKICKKCEKHFPKKIEIDGKERNLQRRKYCLECSPFGQHNTKKLEEIKKTHCAWHGCNNLTINKFCSQKCKWKYFAQKYRDQKRNKAVSYAGGKCQKCGYQTCIASLCFHHVKNKKFTIQNSYRKPWGELKKELDKCILVCRNCHAEIHHIEKEDLVSKTSKIKYDKKTRAIEYKGNKCQICGVVMINAIGV